MVHTILGAGGAISRYAAIELNARGKKIRLVSRNPKKVNDNDELIQADLLNKKMVHDAVAGSEVVYLTAGLKYDTKTWSEQWPLVMRNTIDACVAHRAKLVFFDNVYTYGVVDGMMTESSPVKPSSEKGHIRTAILNMLYAEMHSGKIQALIARSADFYGPDTPNSVTQAMVFAPLSKNKTPQWMIGLNYVHSFTYTPDAGKAMVWLGLAEDTYGQVWHLPTDPQKITGAEFMKLANSKFGTNKKPTILSKWMLRLLGVFMPVIRESMEMLYQFERDYIFDSTKFMARFPDFPLTKYESGIDEVFVQIKRT
jgi:nucleoside-diphosphate-sugar epimerase